MLIPISVEKRSRVIKLQFFSYFDYFVVLIMVLYAGRGNKFFESGSLLDNPIGVSIPIIFSIILALRHRVVFNKQFYILIFCFLIYFMAITVKFGELRPTFFLTYLFIFFIVYVLVKAFKSNLFIIYEQILYYLSIIGFLFWVVQVLMGGDVLFGFFSKIPNIDTFSYVSSQGLNVILYSVQPSTSSMPSGIPIPRNCGFAWEPGAFAVFLCLGIYVNMFLNDNKVNRKKHLWVFVLTLLSTQSTTGYVIFLVILFFFLLNKNVKTIVLLSPLLVIATILISLLPFMGGKIIEVYSQVADIELIIENSIVLESSYAPGRFASFIIAFKDFLNNPILGLGSFNEESWLYKVGADVSAISGIGNLLAQFGIIGFLFFCILSIRSSLMFAHKKQYKGGLLLFILLLLVSVSYSVLFLPIIMSFWMFSLFEVQEQRNIDSGNRVMTR